MRGNRGGVPRPQGWLPGKCRRLCLLSQQANHYRRGRNRGYPGRGACQAHPGSAQQGRYESDDWFQHTELGYNYRISEINCALGLAQMARLEEILQKRADVASAYHQRLSAYPELSLPPLEVAAGRISWFVYVVRLTAAFTPDHRDQILHALEAASIGCARYFAPIHLQRAYADFPATQPLPVTEFVASRTIALPFFNRINDSQLRTVSDTLHQAIRRIR